MNHDGLARQSINVAKPTSTEQGIIPRSQTFSHVIHLCSNCSTILYGYSTNSYQQPPQWSFLGQVDCCSSWQPVGHSAPSSYSAFMVAPAVSSHPQKKKILFSIKSDSKMLVVIRTHIHILCTCRCTWSWSRTYDNELSAANQAAVDWRFSPWQTTNHYFSVWFLR